MADGGRPLSQSPDHCKHHHHRENTDNIRQEHLRPEFSGWEPNLDPLAWGERTGAIRGEAPPLDLFHTERHELGREYYVRVVLEQHDYFVRHLFNRLG